MKWIFLLGNLFTVGWVGYFLCTHIFRGGAPTVITHREMTWICFAAFGSAVTEANKFIQENWK